VTDFIDTHKKR